MRRTLLSSVALALAVTVAPPAGVSAVARTAADSPGHATAHDRDRDDRAGLRARAVPRLVVKPVVRRLDKPWDVRSLPGGALIFTQRDRATLSVFRDGKVRAVRGFASSEVWVSGETGLMGLEVDPDFAENRRVYTCHGGSTAGGGHDVRVTAWTLDQRLRRATPAGVLISGLPATSGRHGGCRLIVTSDGSLLVGTGDAAVGSHPRDLDSLGGKTLRLDRFSGAPWPTNPFADATGARRYVFTYGHRNVQGVAERADGSLWSIEQGSFRDDEVNRLVSGGDYGWHPVPGYDESVPMTDPALPGKQQRARWRSGDQTLATSGGSFVEGRTWRSLRGALAVACLKASRVLFVSFDRAGRLQRVRQPAALRTWGRIRQVVQSQNGDLLVTTDNGSGRDVILRVRPARRAG